MKKWFFLFLLFFILQVFLAQYGIQNTGMSNLYWYQEVAAAILEKGIFNIWTPYPPLFSVLIFLLFQWGNIFFWWKIMNAVLLMSIALIIYLLLKEKDGKETALVATGGFLLLHATWQSTITIGIFFDQFDYIPIFFLLLSLFLFEKKNYNASAVACAIGTCFKIIPGIFLITALFSLQKKEMMTYCCVFFITIMLIILPFFASNAETLFSFYEFSASRNAWETIWHYPEEQYPPIPTKEEMQQPFHEEARQYNWLSFFTAGGIILLMWYKKTKEMKSSTLTLALLLILFIFAKGISSYFIFWLFPLLFLTEETEIAFFICCMLLLTGNAEFLERMYWPSIFARHIMFIGLLFWILRTRSMVKKPENPVSI